MVLEEVFMQIPTIAPLVVVLRMPCMHLQFSTVIQDIQLHLSVLLST